MRNITLNIILAIVAAVAFIAVSCATLSMADAAPKPKPVTCFWRPLEQGTGWVLVCDGPPPSR